MHAAAALVTQLSAGVRPRLKPHRTVSASCLVVCCCGLARYFVLSCPGTPATIGSCLPEGSDSGKELAGSPPCWLHQLSVSPLCTWRYTRRVADTGTTTKGHLQAELQAGGSTLVTGAAACIVSYADSLFGIVTQRSKVKVKVTVCAWLATLCQPFLYKVSDMLGISPGKSHAASHRNQ